MRGNKPGLMSPRMLIGAVRDPARSSAASAQHAWLGQVGFSFDFTKAFDRVPHQTLYNLLVASGLPCNFGDAWLSAITGAKKQCLWLGSSLSR